jgi:predicted nucleic acid-binding protein
MSDVVLHASVFVAACSPTELRHGAAWALLHAEPAEQPFLVPAIFRQEVLAAFARRGESADLLDTLDALLQGPRFCACALDEALLERAAAVARAARLRAYDAVYVALALQREAALLTLDAELGARATAAFPALILRT